MDSDADNTAEEEPFATAEEESSAKVCWQKISIAYLPLWFKHLALHKGLLFHFTGDRRGWMGKRYVCYQTLLNWYFYFFWSGFTFGDWLSGVGNVISRPLQADCQLFTLPRTMHCTSCTYWPHTSTGTHHSRDTFPLGLASGTPFSCIIFMPHKNNVTRLFNTDTWRHGAPEDTK